MYSITDVIRHINRNPENYPEFFQARTQMQVFIDNHATTTEVDLRDLAEEFNKYYKEVGEPEIQWNFYDKELREEMIYKITKIFTDRHYDYYMETIEEIINQMQIDRLIREKNDN